MNKKAVVMISGGLDSTLAAKVMLEQGVELVGVYLSAPWGCCDKTKALKVARMLGIDFMVVKMTQEYINVLRNPKYGYGANMNPCIDCRIYMFEKTKELMAQTGASFLVTGEVLGQRPMSQMRNALTLIEKRAGLARRVVRPLSAKVLPQTVPEEEGLIDRERMYGITGRSRKIQMQLAQQYGIIDYPNPAGGCLLTDREFARRVKDLFEYQDKIDLEDMELLQIGRHFRLDPQTKVIVGRNEQENVTLREYLSPGKLLFEPDDFAGPSVFLIGPPSEDSNRLAVRFIARYTHSEKMPDNGRVVYEVGRARDEVNGEPLRDSLPLGEGMDEAELTRMRIG